VIGRTGQQQPAVVTSCSRTPMRTKRNIVEISDVKRRIGETIERAKIRATERRLRTDAAAYDYAVFLENIGVPLFRQVANVLKVQGYPFSVFTPSGSVRLSSDRQSSDYIEVRLDTTGDRPLVVGHSTRGRGRRVVESERPLHDGPIGALTDEDVMRFIQEELMPFVER
jgi:hypothetical protein